MANGKRKNLATGNRCTRLSTKLQLREASCAQEARFELNTALTKQSFEDIGMTKLELGHEDELGNEYRRGLPRTRGDQYG